ncbi:MAG: substrate-binding domain-containing protein [Verrucomicrobiota bacterium]
MKIIASSSSLFAVAILTLSFSACTNEETEEQKPSALQIEGSNGVWPLVVPLVEAYNVNYPDRPIELDKGMGSSERLQALADDNIQIAMASHGLDPEKLEANEQTPHLFAKMAIVFAVHDSVPVHDLTTDQVSAIYRGDHNNWNELGGPDLPIVRLMRPDYEVDAEVIREKIAAMTEMKWAEDTQLKESSGDLAKALDATEGAIGVTTVVRVLRGEHTVALKLDGVEGAEAAVKAGDYVLTRNCYLVTPEEPTERVQHFLDFVESTEAAGLIKEAGGISTAG